MHNFHVCVYDSNPLVFFVVAWYVMQQYCITSTADNCISLNILFTEQFHKVHLCI